MSPSEDEVDDETAHEETVREETAHEETVCDGEQQARSWDEDELADELSMESFPTSDPPSTWAGHDRA